MTRILPAIVAVFLCLGGGSGAVQAQQACDLRDAVVNGLKEKSNEAPVGRGLVADGSMIEVFATEDGRTWTLVRTTILPSKAKLSCIIGYGGSFTRFPEGKPL